VGRLIENRQVPEGSEPDDFSTYENFIQVAGRRVGEMHSVLARDSDDPDFAPARATSATISGWGALLREIVSEALDCVDSALPVDGLKEILDRREEVMARACSALERAEGTALTRIHGDLHLGQVLVAAGDIIIIDFEGEPTKPVSVRRQKNSPLRDVAGMLRSFDYVGGVVGHQEKFSTDAARERGHTLFEEFGRSARHAFLKGYAEGRGRELGAGEEQLLLVFALEKAAYEIVYEVRNRPDWVRVPLDGFLKLAGECLGASS
jgi:maltose alpha-D-glucosyltransferase/alpha-amylase